MLPLKKYVVLASIALGLFAGSAAAEQIGQINLIRGEVSITRGGETVAAQNGAPLELKDIIRTGADSVVGMTFEDEARVSLGPNSELTLETFVFQGSGDAGNSFDSRLTKGSMSAASGLIAKSGPDTMRVLMPTTVLGVRGTEFAVRIGE
ncbi:MAG: FecR domain-containing protein [Pseudomonadota bacterium]